MEAAPTLPSFWGGGSLFEIWKYNHNVIDSYTRFLRALLNPKERKIFEKLSTPHRVQNYLDALPINFEPGEDTYRSPREVLKVGRAHCFESALLAAAAFAYHGRKPLLMDLRATPDEDDHVVALFRQNGLWGAISKTNHAVLRYRDAVYASPRELAMSYFHEYTTDDGRKVLREYSAPFDLTRYKPERWLIADKKLQWLADALDESRHFPTTPIKPASLRKASKLERDAGKLVEWNRSKGSGGTPSGSGSRKGARRA